MYILQDKTYCKMQDKTYCKLKDKKIYGEES